MATRPSSASQITPVWEPYFPVFKQVASLTAAAVSFYVFGKYFIKPPAPLHTAAVATLTAGLLEGERFSLEKKILSERLRQEKPTLYQAISCAIYLFVALQCLPAIALSRYLAQRCGLQMGTLKDKLLIHLIGLQIGSMVGLACILSRNIYYHRNAKNGNGDQ